MLTSWKQIRTSIEYPLSTSKGSTKKKKSGKSSVKPATDNIDSCIGAHFVQPLDLSHQERANKSLSRRVNNNQKRRKLNDVNTTTDGNDVIPKSDMEPILCVTSPHRVVFMEDCGSSSSDSSDSNLTESKSRNYVTRPGPSTRFALRGTTTIQSTTGTDGTFAGILPHGAQYDPASNLIYAIRNGGSEIAIWTAAPSSTLPGPDDEAVVRKGGNARINGKKLSPGRGTPKKRKSREQQSAFRGSDSPEDLIICERLQIPDGKNVMTLTPFSIPASAVGVAGCCDDGSIWVAIQFQKNGSSDQFQLLTADGSAMIDKAASRPTSGRNTRRKTTSKTKIEDKEGGWMLLDSRATATNTKNSVLLAIQSVILSGDKNQVAFRNHQVRLNKESEDHAAIHIDRSAIQNILQLETSGADIAAKLDASTDSLSIVHKKNGDRWLFTSVELSSSGSALIHSKRTFPLPIEPLSGTSMFSFGSVGQNTVAILMKRQINEQQKACVMSLRIVDFRRKAELSSLSWTEGDDIEFKESRFNAKDTDLHNMLHGKRCNAMVTHKQSGTIALLTSSNEDKGSIDVVFSRLEMSSANSPNVLMASCGSSLASALRSATISASHPAEATKHSTLKATLNTNITNCISSEAKAASSDQSAVDDSVDQARKLLATSANEFVDLLTSSPAEDRPVTNGRIRKGSKASKKSVRSISWKQVIHESCMMITKAKGMVLDCHKNGINGIRSDASNLMILKRGIADDMPKVFIETAFKETATVLLLLQREEASAKNDRGFMKAIQEATCILVEVLQTKLISARADYGIGLLHSGNVFSSLLQACTSLASADIGSGSFGKLHVIDAMLEHVLDIPEGALISILRFVVRNITVDDIIAYYLSALKLSKKGTNLSTQWKEMRDEEDEKEKIGTRLISQVVLEFTSKIVTYSNCNHSFLTKAMADSINTSDEVETLLLTLAKLLKVGDGHKFQEHMRGSKSNSVSLSSGTIHWISALTDAHMGTILKIINEGGLAINKIQRAVRYAMAQSELANDVGEISDLIMPRESAGLVTKSKVTNPSSGDNATAAYTIERLAF
mmetsp:Transcript_13358/g.32421  ORF Transcript_13358/g.32421 Transcript_13358/m.32421 type:complete len:1070 (-) Transcript_13358:38-3247(-)